MYHLVSILHKKVIDIFRELIIPSSVGNTRVLANISREIPMGIFHNEIIFINRPSRLLMYSCSKLERHFGVLEYENTL